MTISIETRCAAGSGYGAMGALRLDSPQDLVGAINNTLKLDSPYTRTLIKAMLHTGIPDGVELALVRPGEGGGGITNPADNAGFCARYTVTHGIMIGSLSTLMLFSPRIGTVPSEHRFTVSATSDVRFGGVGAKARLRAESTGP